MARSTSEWSLAALCRLASRDSQRAERILEALWSAHPRLMGELAISAVDHGEATAEEASLALGVSEEEILSRVETFRRDERPSVPIVVDEETGIARLAEGHVPVWELVREHRIHGSLEALAEAYPALTRTELDAALAYGAGHAAQMNALIERYEAMRERKRAEYPFAG